MRSTFFATLVTLAVAGTVPILPALAVPVPPNTKIIRDLTFTQPAEIPLRLDLFLPPAGANPAPLVIHLAPARGNFNDDAHELVARGYAVALVGYAPAGETRLDASLAAAKSAIKFLRANAATYNLDPQKIGLFGADNSATLAALSAFTSAASPNEQDSRVSSVVMLNGTPDLTTAEALGDESVNELTGAAYTFIHRNAKERPDKAIAASPTTYIDENDPAVLTITGALDHRTLLYQKWTADLTALSIPAKLYARPGSYYDLDSPDVNKTIADWFDKTLTTAPHDPSLSAATRVDRLINAGLLNAALRLAQTQLPAPEAILYRQKIDHLQATHAAAVFAESISHQQYERAQSALWQMRSGSDAASADALQPQFNQLERRVDDRLNIFSQLALVNNLAVGGDQTGAERAMRLLGATVDTASNFADTVPDTDLNTELTQRYITYRNNLRHSPWPAGARQYPWAANSGVDLYGYWMDLRIGGITQRFRYIPPGNFTMGASANDSDRLPDEPLATTVRMDHGFWLAENPTTQELYEAVMGREENRSFFRGPQLPVESLSYAHANNFARALGINARLPSEAEYEYAARGPNDLPAPTGRLNDSAWFYNAELDQGRAGNTPILPELVDDLATKPTRMTHNVKSKLPNAFGLYDMQGNVWEWCIESANTAPPQFHPAKGGSWISSPDSLRPSRRELHYVEHTAWNIGFRILIPAQ